MFKVLILVCSVQFAPQDCQKDNAIDVIWGPDATNEMTCAFTGQAYIADTAVGTGVGRDEYVKVQCIRQVEAHIDQAVAPPGEIDCASPGDLHTTNVAFAAGLSSPYPISLDTHATGGASNWRKITLGTYQSGQALREALRTGGCKVGSTAAEILARPAFSVSRTRTDMDLAVLSVAQLGFGADGASPAEVYARAAQLGFELCPAEIGPQLRLQYPDQPVGEFLRIAMQPIDTDHGEPVVFIVGNGGAGLMLIVADAGRGVIAPSMIRYVFVRPR